MKNVQFIGLSVEELISGIKDELVPELKKQLSQEFQPKQPEELMTRKEVCDLFQIDLSTLHRWRKEEKMPSYGIGNRVYFKRSEVEAMLTENKLS